MVELNAPRDRKCLRCGREEEWDDSVYGWTVAAEAGKAYCIHEWDVNGTHPTIAE